MSNRPEQMKFKDMELPLKKPEYIDPEELQAEVRQNKQILISNDIFSTYGKNLDKYQPGVGTVTNKLLESGDVELTITYLDGERNVARSTILVPKAENVDKIIIEKLRGMGNGWNLETGDHGEGGGLPRNFAYEIQDVLKSVEENKPRPKFAG